MTDRTIQTVLAGLRNHFGMDITFISQFVDGDLVFRFVDSEHADGPIQVNAAKPILGSYCDSIVTGALPAAIPNTESNPLAMSLPVTAALPIGGYLSVPITMSDGSVFGTLCAVGHTPNGSLNDSAVQVLRASAVVIGLLLEDEKIDRLAAMTIKGGIDEIIEAGGPTIFFQPIVETATGRVVGHEALSRFSDGRAPDVWFAEAWATGRGLELELEKSAVRAALRDFPRLNSNGYLSVNFSATTCSDPEALDLLIEGDQKVNLVVEITEHSAIDNALHLRQCLAPFRAHGGRIAIDDVGMGFSGLSQLLELTPDIIKLDRSLVYGVVGDIAPDAIIAAMAAYADKVGATLLAEGVEDQETAEVLQDIGVDLAQGYYYGKPAPPPN